MSTTDRVRAVTAYLGSCLLMLGLALPAPASPSPSEGSPPRTSTTRGPADARELEGFLDGVLSAQLEDFHIPGAAVAVVRGEQLLVAKGYGHADLDARQAVIADRTLFQIGSVTKLFTWTALMQLAERGQLSLDADINTYLEDWKIPATQPQPITPHHLMCHTAGFDEWPLSASVPPEKLQPLGSALAREIPARLHPPGEIQAYSNYGAALAGYIIEQVTGTPYEQYIEENILAPLDMRHSTARQPPPPELAASLSKGYTVMGGLPLTEPFQYLQLGPAGSVSATVTDMAKFMMAHLQRGRYGEHRILREETAERMHHQLFTPDPRLSGCAHGFIEESHNGQRVLTHSGGTGVVNSLLVLLPVSDVGLFVAYNSGGKGNLGEAASEVLQQAFIDRYYPAPVPPRPLPMAGAAQRAERFAGSYRFTRTQAATFQKFFQRNLDTYVSVAPDGALLLSGSEGVPIRWVEVEPLLFQRAEGWPVSARMAFREDSQGRISHLFKETYAAAHEKRPWYEGRVLTDVLWATCMGLFLSTLVLWPFTAVLRRYKPEDPHAPPRSRMARGVAVTTSALGLLFLPGITVALSSAQPLSHIPLSVKAMLALGLVFAVLALTTLGFAVRAWVRRDWSMTGRVHYTMIALAAVAFIWWMHVWNLLGFRY
ncbi:serine hydrolase domain-containing protein [Archangium lansingense]|uniref:Serine hydrolase n=1 Tax=Archangium lansingense TaxID=2995310 RepID=A0ABT4AHL2_9BACT|nr:serine hydrolase domain-containing protein [Archangium lansinium]MCY1081163.1 serine hydrolase [Archangium lansinium]